MTYQDHDLPGEALDFDISNLKKYFDMKSLRVIMEKGMFPPF